MSVMRALLARDDGWELAPGRDLTLLPLPFPLPQSGLQLRFHRLPPQA